MPRSMVLREPESFRAARDLLAKRGYYPKRIYQVLSAGDSGEGCEVVLFVTHAKLPKTAQVRGDKIAVSDGWDV